MLDDGGGETGGTALLPVAAAFTWGTADAPGVVPPVLTGSGEPLFGAEEATEPEAPALGEDGGTGAMPLTPGFIEAASGVDRLVEDGLGIAFCTTAPLAAEPGLAGSAWNDGLAGSGALGLAEPEMSAGFAAALPGGVDAPGLEGSEGLGVSVAFGVALDGRALLPAEPGLAGAALGAAEDSPDFAVLSSGRSVGLPRSSADAVTGVSSLSWACHRLRHRVMP